MTRPRFQPPLPTCPRFSPTALADVPALQPEGSLPAGYEETHAVIRSESHTVTIDQSGGGSSGTFTVDVIGSASASDLASGWGEGTYIEDEIFGTVYTETVETSGGGSNSLSYHLVIGGTYANGTFTITSKTYTETTSYSRWQEVTRTQTMSFGAWYRDSWDTEQSGSYTVTWTAALDPQGVLVYTSYTQESEDSAHWHTRLDNSYGGYRDSVYDTSSSGTIALSGGAGARTGAESWSSLTEWWYPGTPGDEGSESDGESEPVSDTVGLPSPSEDTQEWVWRAPADATGFTYHGVAVDSAAITQSARYSSPDGYTLVYEVPDFEVTSHSSESDHRIYDVAGVPESGTGTTWLHHNELVTIADDVTGSGSYLANSADADYQLVSTATFAVANGYQVLDSETSGTDVDGYPVEQLFNMSQTTNGAGTATLEHHLHDAGPGLEITYSSYTSDGSVTGSTHSWGTQNGVGFDESSVSIDPLSRSFVDPTSTGVLSEVSAVAGLVPFRGLHVPHQLFYTQTPTTPAPLPRISPIPGPIGAPQDIYNRMVLRVGRQALEAAARLFLLNEIRTVMGDPNNLVNGLWQRGSGTYRRDTGRDLAGSLGLADDLNRRIALKTADLRLTYPRNQGYQVELAPQNPIVVDVTYVADQIVIPPGQTRRSGQVAVTLKFQVKYEVTRPDGTMVPLGYLYLFEHTTQIQDDRLRTADLR